MVLKILGWLVEEGTCFLACFLDFESTESRIRISVRLLALALVDFNWCPTFI
jgi:hypothetical protein